MGKIIKITIRGRSTETEAPTVEDAVEQIRDCLDLMRGLEDAVAEDGQSEIVWRLVNARRASPLSIEIEAFPRRFATNIDERTALVISCAARGLAAIKERAERPEYFTDRVLQRTHRLAVRVTNGLDLSEMDFGDDLPKSTLTPTVAIVVARNTDRVLKPFDRPHREIGSAEGYVQAVEVDGHGHKVLTLRHRVTGEDVKCYLNGNALEEMEQRQIRDVYRHARVLVSGIIHVRSDERIGRIDADDLRFFRSRGELPQVDDITDPEFTGGLQSEEYLRRLRDGNLN
jgi:hypothetical protein